MSLNGPTAYIDLPDRIDVMSKKGRRTTWRKLVEYYMQDHKNWSQIESWWVEAGYQYTTANQYTSMIIRAVLLLPESTLQLVLEERITVHHALGTIRNSRLLQ